MSEGQNVPESYSDDERDLHKMDSSTVDKLIPQMFDQMRSNLGMKSLDHGKGGSSDSLINTQSLLKELETLDKLIPMFEHVNSSLQKAVPSHLNRLHEVCKSTNAILDSWVNIQSQAGYVNRLMNSEEYLKYSDSQLRKDDGVTAETAIAEKVQEIESLKQQIEKEESKKVSDHQSSLKERVSDASRPGSGGRVTKSSTNRSSTSSRMKRPSAIPKVTSRLARPTASSSRKMFR